MNASFKLIKSFFQQKKKLADAATHFQLFIDFTTKFF